MNSTALLQRFRSFDFPVGGIAMLRNNVLAIGDRTLNLDCGNIGYIRTSGNIRYSNAINITCDFSLQNANEELYLVLIVAQGNNLADYVSKAFNILATTSNITVTSQSALKEQILKEESIPDNINQIYKITFTYTYRAIPNCIEPIPC